MPRPRIAVVGGGPAGLSAAETLLGRGDVDVDLITLECHLGGNAMSWTTADGRVVEQGQHIMAGFYEAMRGLLRRSGVDPLGSTVSAQGHLIVYEDRDERTHHIQLGPSTTRTLVDGLAYSGFTMTEKLGFAAFFARAMADVLRGEPEQWDDLCATAWCLDRGMPPSIATTNIWRAGREAQFNWPGEISAYSFLSTLRKMGRDFKSSEVRFPAGSMSDIWWEPVGRRIESLGGRIERAHKLVGVTLSPNGLRGLLVARVVPHEPEACFFNQHLPLAEEPPEHRTCYDAAILAIPAGSVQELLTPELMEGAGLHGVPHLRTAAPMGLHVWHRAAVTRGPRTLVVGLEPPFGVMVDNKPFNPAYRDDPTFGAVLHFVGQETGFEDVPDEVLIERALASARRVDGYEGMTRDGVLAWELVRDRAPHRRYWLSEPGSLRYKPFTRTGAPGLYLAGDWVRSAEDFPCMETAVRSGERAAREVLRDLRQRAA